MNRCFCVRALFTLAILVEPLFAQEAKPEGKKQERGGVMGALFGQDPKEKKDEQKKDETPKTSSQSAASQGADRLEPDDTNKLPSDVLPEVQAGRRRTGHDINLVGVGTSHHLRSGK